MNSLDLFKNSCAAEPGESQLAAQFAPHALGQGPASLKKRRGSVHFKSHQPLPAPFVQRLACGQETLEVFNRQAKLSEIFDRQINPVASQVHRHVLPEVGELEGSANAIREFKERRVTVIE